MIINTCQMISTTRPPFRVGYRKRSTTTPRPTNSTGTAANTSTPSPRVTKPSRRKAVPSRTPTTLKPVESQGTTTQSPVRFTNRFKFVSRKPYFKTTTPKRTTASNSTDQTLESTNQQPLEDSPSLSTEAIELADLASALQKVQQAPIPQARPSRKRPQILRLSSQYTSRLTTPKPSTTTEVPSKTTYIPFTGSTSSRYTNKKTVAITVPYPRGTKVTPQIGQYNTAETLSADKFASNIVTTAPLVSEVYNNPQTITAQDFVNKYTPSVQTSTRSRSRYPTTEIPLVIITPGKTATKRRRKPPQAFEKVMSRAEAKNTYKSVGDYDYYDNIEASILGKIPEHSKVLLHGNGIIECLDQGNFPHPVSCKKFISCAKMDNDKIVGWEYTCPKNLSFDPIGGMCNWSAGLGCSEA